MTKTIFEQTGWVGALPVSICQDFDVLIRISEYDYDSENSEFIKYCEARGVLYKAGIPGSIRYSATMDLETTKNSFMAENDFQYFQEYNGARLKCTGPELENHWRCMLSAKGSLQDCWEMFVGRR